LHPLDSDKIEIEFDP